MNLFHHQWMHFCCRFKCAVTCIGHGAGVCVEMPSLAAFSNVPVVAAPTLPANQVWTVPPVAPFQLHTRQAGIDETYPTLVRIGVSPEDFRSPAIAWPIPSLCHERRSQPVRAQIFVCCRSLMLLCYCVSVSFTVSCCEYFIVSD